MLRELIKLTESPRGQLAAKTPEQLAAIRAAAAAAGKRNVPTQQDDRAISSGIEGAQVNGAVIGTGGKSGADDSRLREFDRREGVQAVQQDI